MILILARAAIRLAEMARKYSPAAATRTYFTEGRTLLDGGMMDPRRAAFVAKHALKVQVAAAEHIRDCVRCSRLFQIAFQETASSTALLVSEGDAFAFSNPFDPFLVTSQIIRELRLCPEWPRST